jgi:hypothetical protein
MTRVQLLPGLTPETYQRHSLHELDRVWVEKNCYVDLWIALLHSLGVDPLALMGSCARVGFEDDSFTFFKPSHDEIRSFYGIDVQELTIWRPLVDHALTHLGAGKFISTEADAFYLPDVAGTDYREHHAKTTIVLADLDPGARRLGYFHNAGYYTLDGEDFDATFRLGGFARPEQLPLFAEIVRVDRLVHRTRDELVAMARENLVRHVSERPIHNPFAAFRDAVQRDMGMLHDGGLPLFHAWAFASIRQGGAALELLAAHLRWLEDVPNESRLAHAADAFLSASNGAKAFLLKAARSVNTKRALDATATFDQMIRGWDEGMALLVNECSTTAWTGVA